MPPPGTGGDIPLPQVPATPVPPDQYSDPTGYDQRPGPYKDFPYGFPSPPKTEWPEPPPTIPSPVKKKPRK